jgi:hypothetical protein
MRIRVTRTARKHKIGNAHILAAMRDAGQPVLVPGTDRLLYIGEDDRGIELLVIAVPDNRNPPGLAVIHAMPTAFGSKEDSQWGSTRRTTSSDRIRQSRTPI